MKNLLMFALLPLAALARAEPIGEVDTVFQLIGPDHKIVIDAHDDPKVAGVTCYVARAKTGGIKGGLGLAEDKSEASIACRQVGPISFAKPLAAQEEVFSERISLVFKKLRIVRMVDRMGIARRMAAKFDSPNAGFDGKPGCGRCRTG